MSAEKSETYMRALAEARLKIQRMQTSPNYRSFLSVAAIEAFAAVEGSVLAGKPLSPPKYEA
ncbi:hypothetical protein [Pseudomonas sp. GV071]|uniref:hypothetical protein n=1 Tax=Pseudomonas sp. GV071 TaxID=2135754 RepID=UPI000D333034|nr:hypothetical protein [Pseudomonas sp. GV071]PTQ74306.1 hypothetical protein C8K61_101746 [Pseudomonas sp. GV071]